MNEIKLNRDQADKMIELFKKYENTGSWINSSLDNFTVAVSSLVVEDEPTPNSGYLCEQCTRDLFNGETDNEIAKRMIEKYVEETLKDAEPKCPVAREFRAVFQNCIDWINKE